MTQKEKEKEKDLLLKDLCARLPYGVKIWYKYYPDKITEQFATSIRLVDGKIALSRKFDREGDWYPIEEANELLIKPYLRPMSSMTDKELDKLWNIWENDAASEAASKMTDFLNKKYLDHHHLIEKGLALEAPKDMYKKK